MKKQLVLAMAWCAALVSQAQNSPPPQQRYTAPLSLSSAEGLQRLVLPLAVMQASRSAGYADVQLLGASGEPLPMAWAQAQPVPPAAKRIAAVPRFAWPEAAAAPQTAESTRIRVDARGAVVEVQSTTRAARRVAPSGQASRWVLDLSQSRRAQERIERIALNWPPRAEGLSMQVQVEASDDAVSWHAVTTAALLELPGGEPDAVQLKHVSWPGTTSVPRYLRLNFDALIVLSSAQVHWQEDAAPAPQPSEVFEFQAVAATPQAGWELDLGGAVPVTRIEVQGLAPNSVVAWRLEQKAQGTQAWQPVTSFVAWRLLRQGVEQQSAGVDLPGAQAPARHWRLVADDRTSKPTGTAMKVKLWWQPPQLVFAAGGAQGLSLQVGQGRAMSAAVPLSTLIPGYKVAAEHQLPLATVGALAAVPWHEPTLWEQWSAPNSPQRKQGLLWGVLIAVVLSLGVLALRLSKEMKAGAAPGPQ